MLTGELELEQAARECVANWKRFESFCWFRREEVEDPKNWGIFYLSHRDSGLLDQSNACVIRKALEPFTEADVVFESHSHWAVGHIDGFSIRVFRNDEITEAFRTYHGLVEQLAQYPVLDEEDYSEREFEATLENLTDAAWRLKGEYQLPEGWEGDVLDWFSENNDRAIENRDDQGGYPNEQEMKEAFDALGYERVG